MILSPMAAVLRPPLQGVGLGILLINGAFSAPDGQKMTWANIAHHSNKAGGHSVLAKFIPPDVTYPNGCHICEVEIDPKTGKVAFCDYVVVEDVGTVLSPDLVEG